VSTLDTANTAINVAARIIESPLLNILGTFVPEAVPIIAILQRFAPVIVAATPAIESAVVAGIPVFEAAVAAAPKFGAVVAQIMHQLPSQSLNFSTSGATVENVARMLGGFGKMTPEEEANWMNSMTPHNDPSQENSKFGG
jgi:hypothetical protein